MLKRSQRNLAHQWVEHTTLRIDLARAIRATAGFMTPLILHACGWLPVDPIVAAIVGQNVAMLDVRGDYRLRASLLLVMTLLLAVAAILGSISAGHIAMSVLGAMVVAMGSALWRHIGSNDYGPPFATSSMLLFLLSLAHFQDVGDPTDALLGVAAGGCIGLFIQMILWPVHPQHPLRRVVGESWVAASDYFATLHPESNPVKIATTESTLRTCLDQARKVLSAAATSPSSTLPARLEQLNVCAAQLAVRVGAIHTAMTGLRDLEIHRSLAPALASNLRSLVNTSRSIAIAVVSRQPAHFALCEVRLRRLQSLITALEGRLNGLGGPSTQTIAPLLEQLREVIPDVLKTLRSTQDRAGERALFKMELTDLHTWQLKPLAAALNLSSKMDISLLLFGIRMAVFCGLATWLYLALGIPHGYWLPLTLVVVMQPDYGSTRQKARQRVSGTLAGGFIASLLLLIPSPTVHFLFISIGVFGFAYLLKRHYGIAVIFVTIFVVLLMKQAGQAPIQVELERIGATILGGGLALLAAHLFWPVREQDRFYLFFKKSLQAMHAYLTCVANRLHAGQGINDEAIQAKRHAERAASQLFSSLSRLFSDPRIPRIEVERLAALANGAQRILQLEKLLFVSLRDGSYVEGEISKAYFSALNENLAYLASHASQPLKLDAGELASRMTQLDTLPSPKSTMSAHEQLVVDHLAQAVIELRAVLSAANTIS